MLQPQIVMLTAEIDGMLKADFGGRILACDSLAAQACAVLPSERRQAGKPVSQADAQTAGCLATRKVPALEGCAIEVVDPRIDA